MCVLKIIWVNEIEISSNVIYHLNKITQKKKNYVIKVVIKPEMSWISKWIL